MSKIKDTLTQMEENPGDVRYSDLCKVCEYYFGAPRHKGSSHRIYKTPWQGNPRINIQDNKGRSKAYQVKQVLIALKKLEINHGSEE